MASEILVTMNSLGTLLYTRIDPVNLATTTEISFDEIQELLSTSTFVVQDPNVLEKVFKENSLSDAGLNNKMRRLRLDILQKISTAQLTPTEENGAIDGPNLAPLVESWRRACQCIPKGHHIEEIIFDMTCGQQLELRHIVRLLQLISTTVKIKAGGPFRCQVQGCEADKKAWLEGSLMSV
jgi:hypothetical protein